MPKRRVAVVQAGTCLFDTPKTLERMKAHCDVAGRQGAELVVFPEAYIGGYPKGLDFGARLGSRSQTGRDDYLRYWKSAISVPGEETRIIGQFAKSNSCYLVTGVIEREGASLYCSALFFGPDGSLVANHRKLVPTGSERLIWAQGDGSGLHVLETPLGKLGAAICWENYMPMLRQAMYAKGVNIWCAPTVDERDIWQSTVRHIAYEGRTFVLSACQFLTRADAPAEFDTAYGDDPAAVLIRGGSVIVDPFGEVLAGPVYGQEAVLVAEIDIDQAIRGKYDLDVAGHYARPDVFQLRVDQTRRPTVAVVASDAAAPESLASACAGDLVDD